MVTKVNVLIDGGFFSQKFYELNNKLPKYKDVITEVEKAMQLVKDKTKGIQVYLYKMNHKVKGALIDHCDFVF